MDKKEQSFWITEYPWDNSGYKPKAMAALTFGERELEVHFTAWEQNVRRVQTRHNTDVYCDSCVEFFLQPDPQRDPRHMNFEMNPNGAVYCAVNTPGGESITLPEKTIDGFRPTTQTYEDRWEAWLHIPAEVLTKEFPGYVHRRGTCVRGNFYKCGDKTEHPHFGCWNPIHWHEPDFHRPEFFGEIVL